MTTQEDFLKRVSNALKNAGIQYMISGSIGSSFHGRPRATNDFDIIIAPDKKQLNTFINSLGEEYYLNIEAAMQAFAKNGMFNIIDLETGGKADLILRKNRNFSLVEFERRQKEKVLGLNLWIASPEDIILSKLEWSEPRDDTQQFRDALGVAVVQWDSLDKDYIRKWAKELNIENLLQQLLQQAEKITGGKQS